MAKAQITETIFYAWQSDLPSDTNKNFIRRAIESAVDQLNEELGIENAYREDQDTEGVPGDVNVAEVIFEKIDRCRIFVADITIITPRDADRPCPNPNVLVEYGRASVNPGSNFVVTIFNEAFGDWRTDRPFDIRHRRRPVLYNLPVDASSETRTEVRRRLASDLKVVFESILSEPAAAVELPSREEFTDLRSYYLQTELATRDRGRILGFWCGLIPIGRTLSIPEIWDQEELFERCRSFEFRLGTMPIPFETIDCEIFGRSPTHFQPIAGGAKRIWKHRYAGDHRTDGPYYGDSAAVYITEQGRIAVSVRTDNLDPPHLNVRWIIADVANALNVLKCVRAVNPRDYVDYALFLELRYDEQLPDIFSPVEAGEWRLCRIDDEQGHVGTMVSSDPMMIGPLRVGSSVTYPEVLREVYTRIVTSTGRRPERDLAFELPT